jgi:hypothetical protein
MIEMVPCRACTDPVARLTHRTDNCSLVKSFTRVTFIKSGNSNKQQSIRRQIGGSHMPTTVNRWKVSNNSHIHTAVGTPSPPSSLLAYPPLPRTSNVLGKGRNVNVDKSVIDLTSSTISTKPNGSATEPGLSVIERMMENNRIMMESMMKQLMISINETMVTQFKLFTAAVATINSNSSCHKCQAHNDDADAAKHVIDIPVVVASPTTKGSNIPKHTITSLPSHHVPIPYTKYSHLIGYFCSS